MRRNPGNWIGGGILLGGLWLFVWFLSKSPGTATIFCAASAAITVGIDLWTAPPR